MIRRTSFATLMLLFSTATVYACSCMSSGPPCQAFWKVNSVFSGQVISIKSESGVDKHRYKMRVVRLLVKELFRGVYVPEVEVLTGSGGGDCGFGFQIGQEYVVYAHRRETDQQLVTSICTRTRSLGKAQEDLAYIRGLTKAGAGSTILGEIQRHRRAEEGKWDRSPMPNVKVFVEGGDKNFEAVSDEKGKFTVSGMPAGNYKIRLSLPKGLTTGGNERVIELAEKGCSAVYFGVESAITSN